jgi:ATP synthase protein I
MVKISSDPQPGTQTVYSQGIRADAERANAPDDGLEPDFRPLTAEQAAALRQSQPQATPWRVLMLQVLVGALLAVLTGWISGQARLAASVAWGAVAVVVPAVVFVRALSRQMQKRQASSALFGLFVWELVKIVLTVALLLVAPKVVAELSWLALVAGFVVTMKVYWLAMALGLMQRKSKPTLF